MPNQPTTTFGFESEFQRNAGPLAAELGRRGLWSGGSIHNWHCDCCDCEDSTFKVQRDSTVDGEVISKVFTAADLDGGNATQAMWVLQQAAIHADAEPGDDAGLHVHVQRPRGAVRRAKAFVAYLAWEPALIELAAGRFPRLRSMNRPNFNHLIDYGNVNSLFGRPGHVVRAPAASALVGDLLDDVRTDDFERAIDVYDFDHNCDRHAHLATNTRFSTWEFRIWNSTRSAWRMELAVRYGLAAVNADFVQALIDFDGDRTVANLGTVIADSEHDDRLTELVERQLDYMRRPEAPPVEFMVA